MSSRSPHEFTCVEHSKPAIQKERNKPLLGVMSGVVFFGWNLILNALAAHQPFAPLRFELMIAGGLRSAGGERDRFQWNFWRPVGKQKAVGLLVRVRELRVTEACEK